MDYIINENTLYLYFDGINTIINDSKIELEFKNNIVNKILDNSCMYYGSSLNGRIKGIRKLINSRYKIPIIISEKYKIIFFPLYGIKNNECIWINFNMINNYYKENDFIKVIFNDNYIKKFMCSYTIFNNQILKCSRLIWIYNNKL